MSEINESVFGVEHPGFVSKASDKALRKARLRPCNTMTGQVKKSAFEVEHPGLEDIEKFSLAAARPLASGAARMGRGASEAFGEFKAKHFSSGAKAFGTGAKEAGQMAGTGIKDMAGKARKGLGNMSLGQKLMVTGGATVAAGGAGAFLGRKSFQRNRGPLGKSAFGVDEHSSELSKAENPRQLMTLQRIAGMKVSSVPKQAKNSSKVAEAFKTKTRPTRSAKLAAGQSVSS